MIMTPFKCCHLCYISEGRNMVHRPKLNLQEPFLLSTLGECSISGQAVNYSIVKRSCPVHGEMDNLSHYRDLIQPVIDQVIILYAACEGKYDVGLNVHCPDLDGAKCISHMQKSIDGEVNPDGLSHSIASIARAIKHHLGNPNQP